MCSICYETCDLITVITECNHAFHINCLSKYIISKFDGCRYITIDCPICRRKLYTKDILKEYTKYLHELISYIRRRIYKIEYLLCKYRRICIKNIFNIEIFRLSMKSLKCLKNSLNNYEELLYFYKNQCYNLIYISKFVY